MMSLEHARWRHLRPEGPLTELRLVRLSSALRRYLAQTNELGITEYIGLERVHRMGRRVDGKCRPIVAKFSSFKKREVVRLAGPKLAGKRFGISEQIPKEWQDRRKALLPAFKDAKKQGKRARFVGDKLLVEGHFVTPNTSQRA